MTAIEIGMAALILESPMLAEMEECMQMNVEVVRKFQSIQTVVDASGGVALIALADDGTAWTARAHFSGGYISEDDLEWKRLTDLPMTVEAVNPFKRR